MLQRSLLLFFTLLVFIPTTHAAKINGVEIPDSLTTEGTELVLNGAGLRKKLFLKLYVGSLYLPQTNSDSDSIISADEPMAIRLNITSGAITAKKMEKATREGFVKSTSGNTSSISTEINRFINVFRSGVAEGDQFTMIYRPGKGTAVSKNGAATGIIEGLKFKQALFGIWLSDNPVQENLKSSMLGKQ